MWNAEPCPRCGEELRHEVCDVCGLGDCCCVCHFSEFPGTIEDDEEEETE
jgi:hypothetical protein